MFSAEPQIRRRGEISASTFRTVIAVESRKGAVARGFCLWLRFPSPLIKPDMRICRIRLSDWLHGKAVDVDWEPQRIRRFTPSSPKTLSWENARVPRPWGLDRLVGSAFALP